MCLTLEKRSTSEMARGNLEGKIICDNIRTSKNMVNNSTQSRKSPVQGSPRNFKSDVQTLEEPKGQFQRTVPSSKSPSRTHNSSPIQKVSSATESMIKQYAACKWTEPPSPSTLPHPPKHWMQSTSHSFFVRPFQKICQPEQDIAQQLKVLLKVQA